MKLPDHSCHQGRTGFNSMLNAVTFYSWFDCMLTPLHSFHGSIQNFFNGILLPWFDSMFNQKYKIHIWTQLHFFHDTVVPWIDSMLSKCSHLNNLNPFWNIVIKTNGSIPCSHSYISFSWFNSMLKPLLFFHGSIPCQKRFVTFQNTFKSISIGQ